MLYINKNGDSWDLSEYEKYLDDNWMRMSRPIAEFARDPAQFSLRHPNALHDTSVQKLLVSEPTDDNLNNPLLNIDISLAGQNRDRCIVLSYRDVRAYSIDVPDEFQLPPYRAGHGDLIIHEMTMADDSIYRHEMLFSRGTKIIIYFKYFDREINMR